MAKSSPVITNIAELRRKAVDSATVKRHRRHVAKRRKRLRTKTIDFSIAPQAAPEPTMKTPGAVLSAAALVVAAALAAVSGFFGIAGMTAIFAAAAVPVMVMTGVLEAGKLVTVAWLARQWWTAPLLLRLPLLVLVLLLMALSAVGTFGFLSRAHLDRQVTASLAIDRDAAPLAQRIALAEAAIQDFDGRIVQLDDMVRASTAHGHTKLAMALMTDQSRSRDELVAQRQAAAERLSNLRVEQAGIEAQRASVANETGPALYLAKLFGSDDTEGTVRLITALLVLVLDPLAVLLTIAGARRQGAIASS